MRLNFDHLIGKPYKLGGRGPDVYDCWGVVREISAAIGEPLPDYERDGNTSRAALIRLVRGQEAIARRIEHPSGGCIAYSPCGHIGVLYDGLVFSAEPELGVVALSVSVWVRKYATLWYKLDKELIK